jgi:hypothetical protein
MKRRMRRGLLCAAILGMMIFVTACLSLPRPRTEGSGGYHDLVVRARKQVDGRMKGGRVMLKIQGEQGLVIFLTPLNQVALKLEVTAGGQARLFHPKRRLFWEGTVSRMMSQVWDLPVDWPELTSLLLHGRVPEDRKDLGTWRLIRETPGGWQEAELSGAQGLWRFTVLKRTWVPDTLPQAQSTEGWQAVSLEELFK